MSNNSQLTNGRHKLTRRFIGHDVTIEADVVVFRGTGEVVLYNASVISRPINMTEQGAIAVITNGLPDGSAPGETRVVTP